MAKMALRASLLAALAATPLLPPALHADVATKANEKPKKDPEDKKDKNKKFDFLPEVRPGAAGFVAGRSVDIELAASVGSLRQVEFAIRQAPQNGTLSAIRLHPRETNKAVVTYTHRGGDAPLADVFTYACRLDGGSWSAPATISLSGQRLEPILQVVNVPQFDRIFLGGEAAARVLVRNNGLADFRSEVKWPEPFLGPSVIEVPSGGVSEFQVFARPLRTGDFRFDLVLQPGVPSSKAIFFVKCLQPFTVSPSQLTLRIDPATGERNGVLSLANALQAPVRAILKIPQRLKAPEEVEVAGNSRSEMQISIPAGDVGAFSGELVVVAGADVIKVPIEAKPKPAVLQVLVPAGLSLDFGTVGHRTLASREVVVSNGGGETLLVEARVRAPFTMDEGSGNLRVEPGSQGRFKVVLQTDRMGTVASELELSSAYSRVVVSLVADVLAPAQNPGANSTPMSLAETSAPLGAAANDSQAPPAVTMADIPDVVPDPFQGRTKFQAAIMAFVATKGLPIPRSLINPYLERISSLEALAISRSEVTLAWPKPSVPPSGWLIELASQIPDPRSGMYIKHWTQHKDWELTETGENQVGVVVRGLEPASVYEFRVMGVDREGKVSEPDATIVIETAMPWRIPPWFWRLLIMGVLGALAYFLFRVQRGDFRRPAIA